jgi:hypothetical protein
MPGGTRFRLWPKLYEGYTSPEVVEVSLSAGSISPGPEDRSMYVANAVDKQQPYHPPDRMPPYTGSVFTPAMPDASGHFDRIPEETPQFLAAHLYGSVRRVLDIWEALLGHSVGWWHAKDFPRLELVPRVRWGNAHSGAGYLETGRLWSRNGVPQDMCLNFSIIGHEVGHIILFSVLGAPEEGHLTGAFLALHEAFADMVAAISVLYFDSAQEHMLQQTNGNLYALNLMSRLGELSGSDQVRVLDNDVSLSDLAGLRIGRDGKWIDPLGIGRNEHAASAPLSGAIFDCFVELFQDGLVRRKVINPQLDARRWTKARVRAALAEIHAASGEALEHFRAEFGIVLRESRDIIGLALARCIQRLEADDLDFGTVAARFCEALAELGQSRVMPALIENFRDRGIDPVPMMSWMSDVGTAYWRPLSSQRLHIASTHGSQMALGRPLPLATCRGYRAAQAVAAVNRLIRHPHRGAAALSGL